MSQVFTDYVRSLDPAGEPPDAETFDRVLEALRKVLRRELRRRGLWRSSPRYLGIYGAERWVEPGEGAQGGALEELLVDGYAHIFVRRLRSLVAHLEVKPQIEGLVALGVRQLVHERQKKHDPLGYRVFQILHAAVEQAIEARRLHVVAGGPTVRNDTVLAFRPDVEPRSLPAVELDETVRRWNDELLPALIDARGTARERVVAELQERLVELSSAGIDGFTFREVIEPLKHDARARWPALHGLTADETAFEGDSEETPEAVPLVAPDSGVEERESFERLAECVERRLERAAATPSAREYLATLWGFLRTWAAEIRTELPSRRGLASRLEIPRNRMKGLFTTLGDLVESCREAISASPPVSASGADTRAEAPAARSTLEGTALEGGTTMGQPTNRPTNRPTSRLDELRRRTGEARAAAESALRSHAEPRDSQPRDSPPRAPRPGDLYVLSTTAELPLEWAVVDISTRDPGRLRLVPADTLARAGRDDVTVPETDPCAPLTLRCGFWVWVRRKYLESQRRTGSLSSEAVEQARQRLHEIDMEDPNEPIPRASGIDDPEYRNWVKEILQPARATLALGSVLSLRPRARGRETRGRRSGGLRPPRANPWPVAASVLLAVTLGLSGGLWWQHRELVRTRAAAPAQTLINPPFASVFPWQPERGGPEALAVPPDTSHVALLLNTAEVAPLDSYRLTVFRLESGGAREQILRRDGVAPSQATVTLVLPTELLRPGEYLLTLRDPAGESVPALARYRVLVEPEEERSP